MSPKPDPTTTLRVQLNPHAGTFDLCNTTTGDGWYGLQFFLRCGNKEFRPQRLKSSHHQQGKTTWQVELAAGLQVYFEAAPSPAGSGILLSSRLVNRSRRAFQFTSYGLAAAHGAKGPQLHQTGLPVFAHAENLRFEELPVSRQTYPFIRPLPEVGRWFGRQGIGPIPVMALGRLDQDRWLIDGAASQDNATASWHLALPSQSDRMLDYCSEYVWNGQSRETLAAGQNMTLESCLYLIANAPPDQLYEPYLAELTAIYGRRFAGTTSRLATEPVYCTWNYGIYTNLTEEACLQRIKLAGQLQNGGIFQLDHGYQPPHTPHSSWGYLDAYYPDTTHTWDTARFPGGPRRIVRESRRHGLTPAIWWTPRMDINGPVAADHPDWIAVNRHGQPIEHVGDLYLDYSVPAVRDFIQRTIRTIVHDWGFAGIKLDFFSWAFDAPDLVYRRGGTSVQWRRWLLGMIRRELGPRGYFLYCVSCPLGNPFLALDGCDSFRAGTDIDRGHWTTHVANCSWFLASFPACGRRTWFTNMDSFMGAPDFPAHERRFRCAMGYLTSGMMEFSGPLEQLDQGALRDYRRLCQRCDQGGNALVPDRQSFFGRPLPAILLRPHAANSLTRRRFGLQATVGLFNWQTRPQALSVALDTLNRKGSRLRAQDFWTNRPVALANGVLTAHLPPRHHLLVDIL